jgi:hypothetical protein
VEYKQFIVRAFEREPGKWRASVQRINGKALLSAMTRRRRAIDKFITGMDATAPDAAVRMAIAAIDANAFLANLHERHAPSARKTEGY